MTCDRKPAGWPSTSDGRKRIPATTPSAHASRSCPGAGRRPCGRRARSGRPGTRPSRYPRTHRRLRAGPPPGAGGRRRGCRGAPSRSPAARRRAGTGRSGLRRRRVLARAQAVQLLREPVALGLSLCQLVEQRQPVEQRLAFERRGAAGQRSAGRGGVLGWAAGRADRSPRAAPAARGRRRHRGAQGRGDPPGCSARRPRPSPPVAGSAPGTPAVRSGPRPRRRASGRRTGPPAARRRTAGRRPCRRRRHGDGQPPGGVLGHVDADALVVDGHHRVDDPERGLGAGGRR